MNRLEEIVDHIIGIISHESLAGIIVFGSTVSGDRDSYSDLDLAVIMRSGELSYRYTEFKGRELDILFIPVRYFEETVNEAIKRTSSSLWLTSTLYLKILLEGKILYDPHGQLAYWRKTVGKWQWLREDLELALEYLYENLDLVEELVAENQLLEAIIALTESINLIVTIHVLKANDIPSPQPKDLYMNAVKHGIVKEYAMIHGLHDTSILDEKTIRLLEPRSSNILVLRYWRKLLRELSRGKRNIALLEARNLAVVEAAIESNKPIPLPYIASRKIMIVSSLDEDRYRFLEKIYNTAGRDISDIRYGIETIESMAAVLQR